MPGAGGTREQSTLDAYFHDQSGFWRDIYGGSDVYSVIHQRRLAITLDWVERLGLTSEASVLEIGCGAGVMAVALAGRGLRVHATDTVPSMVELTRQRARDAGVAERLTADLADVQALGFEDAGFDLVIALGVIPWLASPDGAIAEMARVLKPGGTLITSADNAARLNYALDPMFSPRLAPLRSAVKRALIKLGVRRLSDGAPQRRGPALAARVRRGPDSGRAGEGRRADLRPWTLHVPRPPDIAGPARGAGPVAAAEAGRQRQTAAAIGGLSIHRACTEAGMT